MINYLSSMLIYNISDQVYISKPRLSLLLMLQKILIISKFSHHKIHVPVGFSDLCVCVCVYIQKVINKQEKHQCNYKIYNHTYYLNLKSKLRELYYLCFL